MQFFWEKMENVTKQRYQTFNKKRGRKNLVSERNYHRTIFISENLLANIYEHVYSFRSTNIRIK